MHVARNMAHRDGTMMECRLLNLLAPKRCYFENWFCCSLDFLRRSPGQLPAEMFQATSNAWRPWDKPSRHQSGMLVLHYPM